MGQTDGCQSVKRSFCFSWRGLLWKRCFLMNGKCVFQSLFHCTVQEFQIGANDITWNDAARSDVALVCPCRVWTLPNFKAVSKMALANRDEQASQEPRHRWWHNIHYAWKPVWTAGGPDWPSRRPNGWPTGGEILTELDRVWAGSPACCRRPRFEDRFFSRVLKHSWSVTCCDLQLVSGDSRSAGSTRSAGGSC